MADNFTETSFMFACGTQENARKVAAWLDGGPFSEADGPAYPDELVEQLKAEGMEFEEDEDDPGYVRPMYSIADARVDSEDPAQVWAHISEGDLAATAVILRYAMNTMPEVPSPQGFSWASWCSRPRIGEQGGGAVVLARGKDWQWINTFDWLEGKLKDGCKEAA